MSSWTCTACAGTNPAGTAFCGHCGQRPARADAGPTWVCRDCGSANPPLMQFCGRCGRRGAADRQDEARLVTALFADVSGFTALSEQLDTEDLHEVVRPLVAALAGVAEQYGGFVEKYAGDALLAVFGAPVTREDDAQRALAAALGMHALLPDLREQLGPVAAGLAVHIGVNTGRVIAGRTGSAASSDYAVLGDSVILAQRLESMAPSGETWVGATTAELTSDEFDLEPVGDVQVKGKALPVAAFRLRGRRASTAVHGQLVGRDRELSRLQDLLARPGVVLLTGDAGTGKTALLGELRRRSPGLTWLSARCLSYGSALPYWPFADLLRQVTGSSGSDDALAVLDAWQRGLPPEAVEAGRRLLGVPADDVDPRTARHEVHLGVASWLRSIGRVVLALEDAHWLDRASQELVHALVGADLPLTVLLTSRPDQTGWLEAEQQVVALGPLDREAVAQLAAARLGGGVADGVTDLLADRTAGNPLFVEQLAAALADSAGLVRTAQGWDLRPGTSVDDVPTSVERVLAARLDALPPDAAGLLQLMSVVGRVARLPLLSGVAAAEDVSLASLDRLAAAGLLERTHDGAEPAVAFTHALLHDVVYSRLLRRRRRELHARVAAVARDLYGDRDETIGLLARHLWLGAAGTEAADALLRAGRHAARLFANDEAATHLERAVEVLEQTADARLAPALLELAEVQELRGCYDDALRCYERVPSAPAAAGRASVLRKLGRPADALRVVDEALTRAAPAETSRLQLERGWSLAVLDRTAEAVSALSAGLAVPADAGVRGRLLVQRARALSLLGRHDEALIDADAAVEVLEDAGRTTARVGALRVLGDVLLRLGDPARADRVWQRGVDLAEEVGDTEEAAGLLLNLGLVALRRGDLDAALERDRRAVAAFERLRHGSGRAVGYANLAECLLARGDVDESEQYCRQALEHAVELGQDSTRADALRTLAGICLARGDVDAAAAHAEHSAQLFLAVGEPDEAQSSRALVRR